MGKINYQDTKHVLEIEHDAWINALDFIEAVRWKSQYYTYLASLEYSLDREKAPLQKVIPWYIAEDISTDQISRNIGWARHKMEDILNVIFARIEFWSPLPDDTQ